MRRYLLLLGASSLVVACSSSKPAAPSSSIDVFREPSIIGTVDQAAQQGAEEAAEGAIVGRRVGRVAGVIAAVFGGPQSESAEHMVDRYRRTRDAATVAGALIGAVHGGVEGGERGYEFDAQFASLTVIDGLTATRPAPDQIDVQIDVEIPDDVTDQALRDFASVFNTSENRVIDIEAAGDAALDTRDALINLGVPSQINAHRNDRLQHIVLHIRPL